MGAKSQQSLSSSSIGVDAQLTTRALKALLKHHESSTSSSSNLLGNDLDVQVQFTLARIPGNASPKPIRIDIPHPLVKVDGSTTAMDTDEEDTALQEVSVCIIVKEESKPYIQSILSKFPKQLGSIKKVLGLQSLRTKHKSYTQRRELLSRFDIFLADDSILPMLTKALGGKFFDKKKQPIPVNISRKEALPFAIEKALNSTFMYLSSGTCVTVRAGNTSMSPTKLIDNITSITSLVPTKVPRKWSNIRSISVKTTNSVALPIYNKTHEELEVIKLLAKEEKEQMKHEVETEKKGGEDDSSSKKKRKIANTPLAKALKKQKAAEEEKEDEKKDVAVEKKSSKKSAKKKRKESIDAVTEEEEVVVKKTPKSSKKKRKESVDSTTVEDEPKKKEAKTPKSSSKKHKALIPEEEGFISSKKFKGAKKGYVFRKSTKGLGYYKDVLPVVDKAALASLVSKKGRGGGSRKSMGHGMKKKGKGGGRSRRSY